MAVGIVRAKLSTVDKKIAEILGLINYKPKKKRILIKPNVVNVRKPRTGVITHPRVVEALLKYFSGYDVVIGEGSIIGVDTKQVFERTGYVTLAKRYGVGLLDFNDAERISVDWEYGSVGIPEILRTHEYINVPTMKTHIVTKVTLAMKNQKGLLSPADKMNFHRLGLHRPICKLADVVKPDLTLVDGLICVEGDGPGLSGRKKKMNLIIAGIDMIEVDNVCREIMGFAADEIEHIPYVDVDKILGIPIGEVKSSFLRPRTFHKKLNAYYHPFDGCSGCTNSVGEGIRSIRSPIKLLRFLYWATVRRIDFVAGLNPILPRKAQKVICIGNCAARFATQLGLPLVKGCPPRPVDVRKAV